jgi:hypothetical protein
MSKFGMIFGATQEEQIGNDIWCSPEFVLRRKPQHTQFQSPDSELRIGLIISKMGSRSRRRRHHHHHHYLVQEMNLLTSSTIQQSSSWSCWNTSSYRLMTQNLPENYF